MIKKVLITVLLLLFMVTPAMAQRYRQFQFAIVDEFGNAVTNIDQVTILDAGTSTQSTIYADRAGELSMTNPMTTSSTNTGFDQSTGIVTWYQSAASYKVTVTESGVSASLTLDNRDSTDGQFPFFVNYIGEASTLQTTDSADLDIGTDDDFVHDWDNTNSIYIIYPSGDGGRLDFGKDAYHTDVYFHYGDTTTDYAVFDEGNGEFLFVDTDLQLDDDSVLIFGTGDDVSVYSDTADTLTFDPGAAGDTLEIGSGNTDAFDLVWYSDTSGDTVTFDEENVDVDFVDVDLDLDDSAYLRLGTGDDVTLQFDGTNFEIFGTAADMPLALGGTTYGFDLTYYFETSGQFRTDYDADFINLTDDMDLRFGTGASSDGDFQISSGSGNILAIAQVVADTGTMTIGADGTDIPLTWYAETASDYVKFTGDDLQLEDVSLCLGDGTQIQFGDALGTGDFKISDESDVLVIEEVVDGTGTISFGQNDDGVDVYLRAETDSDHVLWDESDEALEFVGANLNLDGDSALIIPDAAVADSTPYTLSANTSGHVQVMPDLSADTTINMPAEADGLHYTFIYGGAADDAHDWIFDTGSDTNYFIGGATCYDPDDGDVLPVYSDGNSNSKMTVLTPNTGTRVEFYCNGTQWYVTGIVVSSTDTAVTYADQ